MALSRRSSQRFSSAIWPGFVDAMTGLLLVLMFVLTIFMVIQFVLREEISGQADQISEQESQLSNLAAEVASLAQALGLSQTENTSLRTTLTTAEDRLAEQDSEITNLSIDLSQTRLQLTQQLGLYQQLEEQRDAVASQLADAENAITGFEAQVAGLLAQQSEAQIAIADLEAERETLVSEQDALSLALAQARDEIDAGTEAARLAAAQRDVLEGLIADLERSAEVDAATIARLQTVEAEGAARISELEAAQLAEIAAAEALRERLANADTELTAMTLALEEQRKEAEETLTLLAATQAARDDLTANLTAALLAQQVAETEVEDLKGTLSASEAKLVAALAAQVATEEELAQARGALANGGVETEDLQAQLAATVAALRERTAEAEALELSLEEVSDAELELQAELAAFAGDLEKAAAAEAALQAQLAAALVEQSDSATSLEQVQNQLAAALLVRESLEAQVAELSGDSVETVAAAGDLRAQLAAALAERDGQSSEVDRQAALLAEARSQLSEEELISEEGRREIALLNEQVAALRNQVGTLQALLDVAADADADAQVQIAELGSQLNTALARAASEERSRRRLEEAARLAAEAEAARLASEAQDLERFRSDFFGQVREVLEGQERVQIVGDRFVFSSEVLFNVGRAELSPLGQSEIANIANILRDVSTQIPEGIDWVIRVDGHTDNVPLSGTGQYRDNWELSQARALSVVRYMQDSLGIPPSRLAANGFGEYQPLNTANTPQARAQNRRIELKLTER